MSNSSPAPRPLPGHRRRRLGHRPRAPGVQGRGHVRLWVARTPRKPPTIAAPAAIHACPAHPGPRVRHLGRRQPAEILSSGRCPCRPCAPSPPRYHPACSSPLQGRRAGHPPPAAGSPDANHPARPACILTGPNFAAEIAAGLPAASVVAGHDPAARDQAIAALATPDFRLYGNDDPIGAQVGGSAKNVIAIAAGAVIGAGLGENARAALVTRGLAELARLATALGGRPETVAGLSGLGDLLLTCTGPSSRNFSFGLALGQGQAMADILAARSAVTEGVATAPALVARARAAGVELPIAEAVAAMVESRLSLADAMRRLLARPLRDE